MAITDDIMAALANSASTYGGDLQGLLGLLNPQQSSAVNGLLGNPITGDQLPLPVGNDMAPAPAQNLVPIPGLDVGGIPEGASGWTTYYGPNGEEVPYYAQPPYTQSDIKQAVAQFGNNPAAYDALVGLQEQLQTPNMNAPPGWTPGGNVPQTPVPQTPAPSTPPGPSAPPAAVAPYMNPNFVESPGTFQGQAQSLVGSAPTGAVDFNSSPGRRILFGQPNSPGETLQNIGSPVQQQSVLDANRLAGAQSTQASATIDDLIKAAFPGGIL